MLLMVPFSILAEISSGPVDFRALKPKYQFKNFTFSAE